MAEGQVTLNLLGSGLIHPFARGGGVPTSRTIFATAPYLTVNGGASGTLAGDITIAAVQSGGGAALVGVGRQLLATAPLTVNGGAAANLAGDVTFACAVFAGTTPGLVPAGVSNPGLFLSQAGWAAGAVSGVASVTAVSPILVSPNIGAVFVNVLDAGILTRGVVPATGAADASKFLCATSPLSWAVPGLGGFIRLQGTTPGTVDTGHGRISGTFLAGQLGIGTITPGGVIEVSSPGAFPALRLSEYSVGDGPDVVFRKAHGTEAAPTPTADGDVLGSLVLENRNSGGGFANYYWMQAIADGAVHASNPHKQFTEFIAGGIGNFGHLRLSDAGLRVASAQAALAANSVRARSSLEVAGSTGLKIVPKTSNFTPDADGTFYYVDATGGNITITLPAASSCPHRMYGFVRVDNANYSVAFAGTISAWPNFQMDQREALIIQSDGSNWFRATLRLHVPYTRMNMLASAAITGVTKASFDKSVVLDAHQRSYGGQTFVTAHIYACGKYSTHASGTNNITFYLREHTPQDILHSRVITLTNGLTNEDWSFHGVVLLNTPSNIRLIWGEVIFYDATGDKRSMMIEDLPLYNGGQVYAISCGVQWSNANAGNQIDQRRLVMNTHEGYHTL